MMSAGIDCGAKNTKTVILKEGKIAGKGSVLTGFDQKKAVDESLEMAIKEAGISRDEIKVIGGTGSGQNAIEMAESEVNEIQAIGKAAIYFFPTARTVVDVGAEEGRVVKVDKKGDIIDFAINEKCAAGAGVFIEAMGIALETPLEEMGSLALQSNEKIPMNTQCVIFAESEVIGLIHAEKEKKDISKSIHDALASRIISMVRRIGVNKDIVMFGGVARNQGFMAVMKSELHINEIFVPDEPELGAAVGAALVAEKECNALS